MLHHLRRFVAATFTLSVCFVSSITHAQSYAALARTFADAPLVARVRVADATAIKPDPGAGVARFYVTASVVTLVRAPGPQAPSLALLADLPRDSRGKPPKLKKAEWLIAGRSTDGKIQLTAPPTPWTADAGARVRAIVAEAGGAGAPGPLRRVSGAFFSPGNVPGESETQIFLDFQNATRGSLSVLRRPGIAPSWTASFGEVASEGPPPAKDTLSWYRLVCGLPAALPDGAVVELDAAGRAAARADYAFVIAQLGSCPA